MRSGGFLLDTPGFSSFKLSEHIYSEDLREYFPEFSRGKCKFKNCLHSGEPGCHVLEELEMGKISTSRYEHYLYLLDEIKKEQR